MPTWLFLTLIFSGLICFLILILCFDWKSKCHKTVKTNKLIAFVSGYVILGEDSDKSNVHLLNGILGVNNNELVFEHSFKNEVSVIQHNISDISGMEIMEYDENIFLNLLRECCNINEDKVRYFIVNMLGLSVEKQIPKLVQRRKLCKITINDINDIIVLFCLKDTPDNMEAINRIMNSFHASV